MGYYDVFDRSFTSLQLSIEEFLSKLDSEAKTPAPAYKSNSAFYVKADPALRAIKTRAAAESKNGIIEQLEELQGSLDDLQGLQKVVADKGLSAADIRSALRGRGTG